MPVKVRCSGCKKVFTAPDKARGKSLRCPHCDSRVRVPAEGRSAAAPKPKKKKRSRQSADGDFLSGLDLRRMEDRDATVCQKCGASVSEDDELCPECGVDLVTGQMPAARRKGPDPSKFYGEAWSDSWAFLMENKPLALKTGLIWTLFALLYIGSAGMTFQAVVWQKPPVVVFFGFMSTLFMMGLYGWYWFLSAKIIEATMQKKKQRRLKKIQFDFFQTVVFGFKGFFWPYVLLLPVFFVASFALVPMVIAGSLVMGNAGILGAGLVALGINLLPLFAFPVAQVHMTMRYTYKAFLPWDMLKLSVLHAGASLYWLLMAFVVTLPVIAIVAVTVLLVGASESVLWGVEQCAKAVAWMVGLIGQNPEVKGFIYYTIAFVVAVVVLVVLLAAFLIPLGFCAVFLMRANGLIGYYNRRTLELVNRQKPNVPCGFWVRYLAFLVDNGILYLIGLLIAVALGLLYFVVGGVVIWVGQAISILLPIWYFTKSESGIFQGTLGKRALGIIVTDLNGKQITTAAAFGRYFGRILSALILYGGFIMAAFTEKKQTLHDQLTKTLVVWQGDDERS
jgi:uncharacterized RDD family membrane protein YckC/DNA-directed RNA polymerase subunit RPC12/RpoP